MTTYTFQITMSDEAFAQLMRKAEKQKAPSLEDYVRVLIEKDVEADNLLSANSNGSATEIRSLEEILAPVHRQVEASGISDDELNSFFETLRDEVYKEKLTTERLGGQTA